MFLPTGNTVSHLWFNESNTGIQSCFHAHKKGSNHFSHVPTPGSQLWLHAHKKIVSHIFNANNGCNRYSFTNTARAVSHAFTHKQHRQSDMCLHANSIVRHRFHTNRSHVVSSSLYTDEICHGLYTDTHTHTKAVRSSFIHCQPLLYTQATQKIAMDFTKNLTGCQVWFDADKNRLSIIVLHRNTTCSQP